MKAEFTLKYSKKEILLIVCLSPVLVAILLYSKYDATINNFIATNSTYLIIFIIIFGLVALIAAKIYQRSLDETDDETEATASASVINIILWCCFWISWCVFNVVILLRNPVDLKLIIFSFLITNLPGILIFFITLSMRRDQIKDREHLQDRKGFFTTFTGDDRSLSFQYYSGFYGLVTIPLYLLALAVYFLVSNPG